MSRLIPTIKLIVGGIKNDPFAEVKCHVVDVGHADNILVIESVYVANLERSAAALAADLEGACRRLAELGEPINSKPKSLVDWEKMKEVV